MLAGIASNVVLVAAFDRVARNVRHFLEVLDELSHLGIEFVSLRENIDTGGPLGRAMVVFAGAIAELEKSLIAERVKAGMRRSKLEGRRLGRKPLDVDRVAVVRGPPRWSEPDGSGKTIRGCDWRRPETSLSPGNLSCFRVEVDGI